MPTPYNRGFKTQEKSCLFVCHFIIGLFSWPIQIGGGIGGNHAGAAQPGEKAANTAEPGNLGIDDQRFLGARGTILVEVKLISFHGAPTETCRRIKIEDCRPLDESLERAAVGVDGTLPGRIHDETPLRSWYFVPLWNIAVHFHYTPSA